MTDQETSSQTNSGSGFSGSTSDLTPPSASQYPPPSSFQRNYSKIYKQHPLQSVDLVTYWRKHIFQPLVDQAITKDKVELSLSDQDKLVFHPNLVYRDQKTQKLVLHPNALITYVDYRIYYQYLRRYCPVCDLVFNDVQHCLEHLQQKEGLIQVDINVATTILNQENQLPINEQILDYKRQHLVQIEQEIPLATKKKVSDRVNQELVAKLADLDLDLETEFQCAICWGILTKPVTLPCGHWFDQECWNEYVKSSDQLRCPMCRTKFPSTLKLKPSAKLNSLMEKLIPVEFAEQQVVAEQEKQLTKLAQKKIELDRVAQWFGELLTTRADFLKLKEDLVKKYWAPYELWSENGDGLLQLIIFQEHQQKYRLAHEKEGCHYCKQKDHITYDCQAHSCKCPSCGIFGHHIWSTDCPNFLVHIGGPKKINYQPSVKKTKIKAIRPSDNRQGRKYQYFRQKKNRGGFIPAAHELVNQ